METIGVPLLDAHEGIKAQQLDISAQDSEGVGRIVDKMCLPGTAAERLETEGPNTAEEVQDTRSLHLRRQDVKNRLPDAVEGRTDG